MASSSEGSSPERKEPLGEREGSEEWICQGRELDDTVFQEKAVALKALEVLHGECKTSEGSLLLPAIVPQPGPAHHLRRGGGLGL